MVGTQTPFIIFLYGKNFPSSRMYVYIIKCAYTCKSLRIWSIETPKVLGDGIKWYKISIIGVLEEKNLNGTKNFKPMDSNISLNTKQEK